MQEVDMDGGGGAGPDGLDQGDFAEHILFGIAAMEFAVDDGKARGFAMAEDGHGGHGKKAIQLAGGACQPRAGVLAAFEVDSEENVGLNIGVIDLARSE